MKVISEDVRKIDQLFHEKMEDNGDHRASQAFHVKYHKLNAKNEMNYAEKNSYTHSEVKKKVKCFFRSDIFMETFVYRFIPAVLSVVNYRPGMQGFPLPRRHLLTLFTLVMFLIQTCLSQRIINPESMEEVKVAQVASLSGQSTVLPCLLSPQTPGDRPKLVLWYRTDSTKPVVSYDGRAPRLNTTPSAPTSPQLSVSRTSASLSYPHLTMPQAGVYECRVDFFRSPTHVSHVNLTVIEPPGSVTLTDQLDSSQLDGLLGPYPQWSRLTLTCLVRGGSPSPRVRWYRNGEELLLEEQIRVEEPRIVRSNLVLPSLDRKWHNSNVTCAAFNTNLTAPVIATATIRMHLEASSVVVQGPANTVAGEIARLQCWARGSTPPAQLIWRVNGQTLHPHREESSITDGVSTSTVEVKVTRADNGAVVSCTARNPAVEMPKPPTNTTTLVVYYPPTVSVEFGLNIEPRRLKEGDDVYLRCKVSANPPPDKIIWYHGNEIQKPNRTRGIIISVDSLVLQVVDRHMAGQYRCAAANHLANATSNPLPLKLAYKPVCMMPSTTTYFIYDQPINVTCHVASHPPATRIDWYWNSGNDIISLQPTSSVPELMARRQPPTAAEWDRSWARLSVRPSKHQEDRQLSCWANNAMGRQETPCRFFIRVAKTPAPLSSCRLANITASSLSLACARPPHQQSSTTLYIAEVYEEDDRLLVNLSSDRPWFNVSHLDPGTAYKLKVYVAHGPVVSAPMLVSAYTSNTPIQQPSRPTTPAAYSVKGSLVATGIAVALCVIGVIIAIVRRAMVTSSSSRARNSTLSKTMSSATARTPLSKSTGSLNGNEDALDMRDTSEKEDSAGFESKALSRLGSKGSIFDDSDTTHLREEKIEHESSLQFTVPTNDVTQLETPLAEHQLMIPKFSKSIQRRDSPDGRNEDIFKDSSSIKEFQTFAYDTGHWSEGGSKELLASTFSGSMSPEHNFR